jgi:2-oxoisovalerate dehydrogenase E1 component
MSTAETAAQGKQSVAASDRAYLLDCLKKIIHIRAFEQCALEASQAIPPKVVGSIHLCAGQEAVPVSTVAGLDAADQIIATYRGHGWALVAGLRCRFSRCSAKSASVV